jgi:hypothetical protein
MRHAFQEKKSMYIRASPQEEVGEKEFLSSSSKKNLQQTKKSGVFLFCEFQKIFQFSP